VALVLQPALRNAPPDRIGQVVTLAYPFGDLVLIGVLLGALPMMSWRVDGSWLLLGVGLLCHSVGDATYAAAVDDVYHNGPYDFLWSAGSVAIAGAAWIPTVETRPAADVVGWRAIALPFGAQVFAIVTQIFGYFVDLPPIERFFTLAVLGIGATQIFISRRGRTPNTVREGLRHDDRCRSTTRSGPRECSSGWPRCSCATRGDPGGAGQRGCVASSPAGI
jgi:hypothetical protein